MGNAGELLSSVNFSVTVLPAKESLHLKNFPVINIKMSVLVQENIPDSNTRQLPHLCLMSLLQQVMGMYM